MHKSAKKSTKDHIKDTQESSGSPCFTCARNICISQLSFCSPFEMPLSNDSVSANVFLLREWMTMCMLIMTFIVVNIIECFLS